MKALGECLNSLIYVYNMVLGESRSTWKMYMRHHIEGKFVVFAHFCCWCCYTKDFVSVIKLDDEEDMVLGLCHNKIDPATPEFLEIAIGFLHRCSYSEISTAVPQCSRVLCYILKLYHKNLFHKELNFLLTFLSHFPLLQEFLIMVDDGALVGGIKRLVMEAVNLKLKLKDQSRKILNIHSAVVLGKIWHLKADIFIQITTTLRKHLQEVNEACRAHSMEDLVRALSERQENFSVDETPRFIYVCLHQMFSILLYDHLNALQEGYTFMGYEILPRKDKEREPLLEFIERVPKQLQSVIQSSREDAYFVAIKVRDFHFQFYVQMMLFEAIQLLMVEIEKIIESLSHNLGQKLSSLFDKLYIMLSVAVSQTANKVTEDEKLLFTDLEVVATEMMSLCIAIHSDSLTEEEVLDVDFRLLDLLQKLEHLNLQLKEIYLQFLRFTPKTTPGSCLFFQSLLQKFRYMIERKQDFAEPAVDLIEEIRDNLEFIMSTFGDLFERGSEETGFKNLQAQLTDAAYVAEYMADLIVVNDDAVRRYLVGLQHSSEEIERVKLLLGDLDKDTTFDHGTEEVPPVLKPPIVLQATTTRIEHGMVGLLDEKKKIVEQLIRGSNKREIVSIVGMPGVGKTTMALNLFRSEAVKHHFSIRARCVVSQRYNKRDLLLSILSHIISITDSTHAISDDDLQLMLYRKLKTERYLILMDDMWSTKPWEDLQLSFPDDSNGSRILITSRLQDVVSKISVPNPLRLLSEEESFKLLKIKIFSSEKCPKELLEIGEDIAKRCRRLPLAIGAIAGLLRTNVNQVAWKEIARSVSSHVINDPETQCKELLELSYNHLPDHLKACLLYVGAFPEDKDIPVQKLQWLWMAEGFVREVDSKSVEDMAEDYFRDLVGRNLLMVAKRRSNGKVKICRVHDVVRDLCLLKAKDEKFSDLISTNDEPYSSFHNLDSDVYDELFSPSDSRIYSRYRLCFYVNREHFAVSRPSGPFTRSLQYIATSDTYPRCPYDVSFISHNFKRLSVLDLESIYMGSSFGNDIELLVLLRYLAVSGDMESIPPSFSKLQNLETLVVKGLKKKIVLPDTIWRMKKLRHIHITNRVIFTLQRTEDGSSSKLDNLVTLSVVFLKHGEGGN
ncbi:OLC1v1000169C1 [Oldenlandia corymbosa var. corymbosa]|uniref:OLC1v1000169C1 n=1 Tax=Oldenlandia corymbosa var. corymbosa TaxID=529605 RepID=A0AAV1D377_OLDCO|nr:OLC1v1000169C1 [Oldenlandia corymbosa var. corymbosa]